jgi:hypothetical protein
LEHQWLYIHMDILMCWTLMPSIQLDMMCSWSNTHLFRCLQHISSNMVGISEKFGIRMILHGLTVISNVTLQWVSYNVSKVSI